MQTSRSEPFLHARYVSVMAYETDFNMIPDIDIPIFVTFLKRQYAEINDS